MTRFALYFIPPSGTFYETGSSLVGYNIRKGTAVSQPSFIDPAWTAELSEYGFHMSITDAIEVDDDQLEKVSARVSELLKCFRPSLTYEVATDRIGFWRPTSNMAVMVMKPNRNVELLHDVLVTDLHPLGKGSHYAQSYLNNAAGFTPHTETDIQRTKLFFSPFIFDDFVPHFTCIGSFAGPAEERPAIEAQLKVLLTGVDTLTIDKLALVVQRDGEPNFHIFKEFSLHGDQQ